MGMVHILNFMHAITPNLTLGFALTHTVSPLVAGISQLLTLPFTMLLGTKRKEPVGVHRAVRVGQIQVLHAGAAFRIGKARAWHGWQARKAPRPLR